MLRCITKVFCLSEYPILPVLQGLKFYMKMQKNDVDIGCCFSFAIVETIQSLQVETCAQLAQEYLSRLTNDNDHTKQNLL